MSNVRVNLLMQESLEMELADIAKRDQRSVADVIREACREYIYRDKRKGISKFYDGKTEEDVKEVKND